MPRKVATVAYIAMRCMQHDTVVALAFRRALGIVAPSAPPAAGGGARGHVGPPGGRGAYEGMAECFENRRAVLL